MGNRRLPGFKWAEGTSPSKEEQESSKGGFTLLCLLPPTTYAAASARPDGIKVTSPVLHG